MSAFQSIIHGNKKWCADHSVSLVYVGFYDDDRSLLTEEAIMEWYLVVSNLSLILCVVFCRYRDTEDNREECRKIRTMVLPFIQWLEAVLFAFVFELTIEKINFRPLKNQIVNSHLHSYS